MVLFLLSWVMVVSHLDLYIGHENVVHGIPNDKPLEEGDVISIDCGTNLRGFCGDSPTLSVWVR